MLSRGFRIRLLAVATLSLAAVVGLTYGSAVHIVSSGVMRSELDYLHRQTRVLVPLLSNLVHDRTELEQFLLSTREQGQFAAMQVLGRNLELSSPHGDSPADVLVGPDMLGELRAQPGRIRQVEAPGHGSLLAILEPLPQGGYLFAARSLSSYEERRASLIGLSVLWGGLVLLALILVAFLVVRSLLTGPVRRLVRQFGKVAVGEEVDLPRSIDDEDFGTLRESMKAMALRIQADRRQIKDQVARLEEINLELVRTQEKLIRTEKLASVGQLAAGMAHEIGNPIGVVLGYLDMLIEGKLSEEQRHQAHEQIRSSVHRVDSIIKDLLNFSRPALDEEVSSPAAGTVSEVFALLGPQKRFRNVVLKQVVAEGEDVGVAIPPSRYKQVLLNLLFNAADAMSGAGTLTVTVTPGPHKVTVSVADTGPGIREEIRYRLFDPFFSTKPVGEGTGLGLFVCHTIVTRYNGRIDVENGPEGGAVFSLHLRLAQKA